MRIIFSRKGFDSSSGGKPSPIKGGRPISLPIPATKNSVTTYGDLGLGQLVQSVTKGKYGPDSLCHADPFFADRQCAFGQTGAAQGHLSKNDVGRGDVFLFFGLFADEHTGERHHRIYGYMVVDEVVTLGSNPDPSLAPTFAPNHPHLIGTRDRNNTLYLGRGTTSAAASPKLRLTQEAGPLCTWAIPTWIEGFGLTYHRESWRWPSPGTLLSAARGQEFICEIGGDPAAKAWLEEIIVEIEGAEHPDDSQADVVIAMLRQPRLDDPAEQRDDPFWEFGSFGVTGCHGSNLLNPRKAHELSGKRIAFAQGGSNGIKLIYVTPPVSVHYHSECVELNWAPAVMPLTYDTAPTLIDNTGFSDFPALLDLIGNAARPTPVSQFASKFRSRREPVPIDVAKQLLSGFENAERDGRKSATSYIECLPYPPPRIDQNRRQTYDELVRYANGMQPQTPCKTRC